MIRSLLSKKAVSMLLPSLLLAVPCLAFARSPVKTVEDVSLHSGPEIAHAFFAKAIQSDTVPGISVAIAGARGHHLGRRFWLG